MCGRYAFDDVKEIFEARIILEEIAGIFGKEAVKSLKQGEIFPTDIVPVVAETTSGSQAMPMEWGYKMWNSTRRIINARAETLMEKPMFRKSMTHKKCLIPCTGFYEWQKTVNGKQKYHIRPKGENFFYLAGIYNSFNEDTSKVNRFTIITCPANEFMKPIHHRMPLIVLKNNKETWLNFNGDYNLTLSEIYRMTNKLETKIQTD